MHRLPRFKRTLSVLTAALVSLTLVSPVTGAFAEDDPAPVAAVTEVAEEPASEAPAPQEAADAATDPAADPATEEAAAAPVAPDVSVEKDAAMDDAAAEPAVLTELWVNGSTGDDANAGAADATALKSLAKALELQKNSNGAIKTIHVAGAFDALPAATIPAGVTLVVSADTTMAGAGANGLTLAKGSTLRGENGVTLSMSGFDTAILVQNGATLTDGTYVLNGNKVGLNAQGAITGTSREALNISIDSTTGAQTGRAFFYSDTARFAHATLKVSGIPVMAKKDDPDYGPWGGRGASLYLDDVSMSTEGIRFNVQGASSTVQMKDSTFMVKGTFTKKNFFGFVLDKEALGFIGGTPSLIEGSHIIVDGAVFTMQGRQTYRNSTIEVKNSGMGAMNINWGANVTFDSSTIKVDENVSQTKIVVGGSSEAVNDRSSVTLTGDTVLLTPAKGTGATTYDGIALGPTGQAFVVTGGSYLTAFDGKSNLANTQATNGEANGNEKLSLFTLADSSVSVLNPLNKNGQAYEYRVANATSDGQKHVWVPAATMTFALNDPALADDAKISAAKFADKSTADKTVKAIRGHAVAVASSVVAGSTEVPAEPSAEGYEFLGWFYKDASGKEQAFDAAATAVTGDMTVYAKWENPAVKYSVVYHTNLATDTAYSATYSAPDRAYTAISVADAAAKEPAFNAQGRTFVSWNTKADGTGETVNPGDDRTLAEDVASVDLYAQWQLNVTPFPYQGTINADMWGDSASGQADSKSALIVDADAGESFSLTGAVDVSAIKQQMTAIEGQFPGVKPEDIRLSGTASTFTAALTLPEGVTVPSDLDASKVQAEGLGSLFKVDDVTVSGRTVTVKLGLTQSFDTYLGLKEAVNGAGNGVAPTGAAFRAAPTSPFTDQITLTIPGFTLAEGVGAGELTATGTVAGSMQALAQGGDAAVKFDLSWNGTQVEGGKDVRATDDTTIQQTILVKKALELGLPADMLASAQRAGEAAPSAGTDTTSKAPLGVYQGDKINLTGTIDTKGIKDQMVGIEATYGVVNDENGQKAISIADPASTFTATFTVPEGMTLPAVLTKDTVVDTGFADTFEVSDLKVEGKTVTVTFNLKNASGIKTYADLKAAVYALDDTMKLTVPGIAIDEGVADGTELTVTGGVSGTFSAVATGESGKVRDFSFKWTGTQTDEGRDARATGDVIQLTVATPTPLDLDLPSDILGDGETEHASVHQTLRGDTVDLTGAVDITGIKEQMEAIEGQFNKPDPKTIAVDLKGFGFTATMTVPEGMELPTDLSKVTADGLARTFKVSSTKVDGKTFTVTFELADRLTSGSERITNYFQLKQAVAAAGVAEGESSWLKITVPGVKVTQDAPLNTDLTVTGAVSGFFKAVATGASGTQRTFSFRWNGSQWADGKDAAAPDGDASIRYTTRIPAPMALTLPGDILSGGDTEHEAVYAVYPGRTLDLTGAVKIDGIKQQMVGIEGQFGNPDGSTIAIDVKDFGFTATLTVPDGMTLPENVSAGTVVPEGLAETFEITEAKAEGQKVTITFGLKNAASLDTYAKLKAAVDAAGVSGGAWLRVTVPGVTVNDDVQAGQQLVVRGTVDGRFKAIATSAAGTAKAFSFAWTGEQWAEGKDAVAGGDASIRFTAVIPQSIAQELPGDMLTGSDTTHEATPEVAVGSSINLTGLVKIDTIKQQMAAIEGRFGNPDGGTIAVDVKNFGFTATMTVPEGMTLPADLTKEDVAKAAEGLGDTFEITGVKVEGQKVTITFGLKDAASLDTYAKLKAAVDASGVNGGTELKVTVPGIKIASDLAAGTVLTSTGTVTGEFGAVATSASGRREVFVFDWTAKQLADGKDALATDDDTIQLSMKIASGTVTVKYMDEQGNEIAGPETLTGAVGAAYTAEKKSIDGYEFKELQKGSAPESGTFAKADQTVTYVYQKVTEPTGGPTDEPSTPGTDKPGKPGKTTKPGKGGKSLSKTGAAVLPLLALSAAGVAAGAGLLARRRRDEA